MDKLTWQQYRRRELTLPLLDDSAKKNINFSTTETLGTLQFKQIFQNWGIFSFHLCYVGFTLWRKPMTMLKSWFLCLKFQQMHSLTIDQVFSGSHHGQHQVLFGSLEWHSLYPASDHDDYHRICTDFMIHRKNPGFMNVCLYVTFYFLRSSIFVFIC